MVKVPSVKFSKHKDKHTTEITSPSRMLSDATNSTMKKNALKRITSTYRDTKRSNIHHTEKVTKKNSSKDVKNIIGSLSERNFYNSYNKINSVENE